jgi:hypothetical protein
MIESKNQYNQWILKPENQETRMNQRTLVNLQDK